MHSAVLFSLLLTAAPAFAEGAQQEFNCQATQICDDLGSCSDNTDAFVFRISPVDVDPNGEGKYYVEYDDMRAEAFMRSDYSLLWSTDRTDLQTLMFTAEKSALRVVVSLDEPVASKIHFLTCETPG